MALLTERVTVAMPAAHKARLVAAAGHRDLSLGALMREILSNLLAEQAHDIAPPQGTPQSTNFVRS